MRSLVTHVVEAGLQDAQGDYSLLVVGSVSLPLRNCTSGEIYRKVRVLLFRECVFFPRRPSAREATVRRGYWAVWQSTELHHYPQVLGRRTEQLCTRLHRAAVQPVRKRHFPHQSTECVACWA